MRAWKSTSTENATCKASHAASPGKQSLIDSLSEPVQRNASAGGELRRAALSAPVQRKSGVGQAGDVYEQHADAVATEVVAGRSAERLLDGMSGGGAASAPEHQVQRKDVPTHFGTFKTSKFEKYSTTGVNAVVEFHPDPAKIDAKKIGMSQSVVITYPDGTHTGIDPTKEGRRVKSGAGKDYVLDRISSKNNPIYGAGDLGANDGIDKTAADNNPSADPTKVATPADGGNATYQLGHAFKDAGVQKTKEAALYDRSAGGGGNMFETTALGLEGTDKDKYFGSVKWGYVVNGADVDIKDIELASMGVPTPKATAQVFATALQQDLAGSASPWGRLWADGDPLGPLGATLVELGRPAVPALIALLDDATPRDSYLGSEEATDMAMRRYRVKDFAAFYLARITGADLPWQRELAKRDEAIASLRAKL